MNRSIVIAGPPGAGKTTVAKEVALQAGLRSLDLDQVIEESFGASPAQIIRKDGEKRLRIREADVLESLKGGAEVIALGGGTLTFKRSRRAARALGAVIGLDAELDTLLDRVGKSGIDRPLLEGDAKQKLAALLDARKKSYAAVDVKVDAAGSPSSVAAQVIAEANKRHVLEAKVAEKRTRVIVGRGLSSDAAGALAAIDPGRTAVAIIDKGVPSALRKTYVDRWTKSYKVELIEVDGGEAVKTWEQLGKVLERAIANGAGRQSAVIGLGGGATCDLAGLAASLLGRGAPLLLIPTTLLAQADASIGGKCAVNAGAARNSIGAFFPAEDVIVDLDFLASLDSRDLRAGLAEIVKMGVIADDALFEAAISGPIDEALLTKAIAEKAKIVAADPFEHGDRKLLNLGHTLGHALEAASGFTMRHGDAVAIGMAAIARCSAERGLASRDTAERIISGLERAGLPTRADPTLLRLSEAHFFQDKKGDRDEVDLVMVQEVGKTTLTRVSWIDATSALLRSGGGS